MRLPWSAKEKKRHEITSCQGEDEDVKNDTSATKNENDEDKDKKKDEEKESIVNRADAVTLAREVVLALQNPDTSLSNKYLYLGPHGASAWEDVEKYGDFPIQEIAKKLLRDNIDKILDAIQNDSGDAGMDVVSLGTGTGSDDIIILQKLWLRDPEETTFFAVDLGRDLLHRAIKKIKETITPIGEQDEATFLRQICIDISQITTMQDYFKKNRRHSRRLYHLLGLTLGNNNEYVFLEQISAGMLPGDYLLIGVDFCVDDRDWTENSKSGYDKVGHKVDHFVSGPLKTAIALANDSSLDKKFNGVFLTPSKDRCDFLKEDFQIVKKPIERADKQDPKLSCIPNSLSFARFYVPSKFANSKFDALNPKKRKYGKLCDFSNKYKSSDFEKWLYDNEKPFGLKLMREHEKDGIKLWGKEYQHLVLLKKTDQPFDLEEDKLFKTILNNLDRIFITYQSWDGKSISTEAEKLIESLRDNYATKRTVPLKTYSRLSRLLDVPEEIDDKDKMREYLNEVQQFLNEVATFEV